MARFRALAVDYDGTLAHDGHVDDATVAALVKLHDVGCKVILVTGRQVPELKSVFPAIGHCDIVVAENGGLLYWPSNDREEVLGEPPPEEFITEVARWDVKPFSIGKVVFATWRPHETAILDVIQRLGIGYQIIFNKRAVMVLPSNVNKASGLCAALELLVIPPEQVAGVGDAENDHAFLDMCGLSVAVNNALPALKTRCDRVTAADHGRGVQELIGRLLEDGLLGGERTTSQPRQEEH